MQVANLRVILVFRVWMLSGLKSRRFAVGARALHRRGDLLAIHSTDYKVTMRKWMYDIGRFISRNEGFLEVIL